jgi:nucleoside-diphosphate-sugar epimerase
MPQQFHQVLITGGAGYAGAVLVPKLLQQGLRVRVLDLYLYGTDVFDTFADDPNLEQVKGDLRDVATVRRAVAGCDAVLHLACISNDPSFELDPALGKSINYDAFLPLVRAAKDAGARRFIFASSSSVYGVKREPEVTEELALEPLTDYARFKAMCEEVLFRERQPGFETLTVRPATLCGWSPRLRLDLSVNILTSHAVRRGTITVFGGEQQRPNLHVEDMADFYVQALQWPATLVDGKTFNVGCENLKIIEIAELVRRVVGPEVRVERTGTNDHRSYRVSAEKARRELGFVPRRGIEQAVRDLTAAFRDGRVGDPDDCRYHNIKTMQKARLR